ncbi:MAG: transcriptional repressor LexA [Candidatus Brocadiia bacterium]|nr:MAG: transcriptional repressor LexA [Candidatus Brocadiia bacterium]
MLQTTTRKNLTPRQLQILKATARFQSSKCYSPTIAELASALSVSRSTAFEHIAELREKGLLTASPGRARSLIVTSRAQELLEQAGDSHEDITSVCEGIPLAGKVAAGLPIEAVEDLQRLSLDSCFGNDSDIFALEVTGDSMIDDGIYDGDYVICRRCETAHNGQLVIAIVDDDNATLKRFYRERDRIRLQPANDNYEPIYCSNCRIQAVVTGLIRKF